MLDLHPAARELTRVLDGVADEHLDGPTPCPGYSVGALLDHVCGLTLAFTWAAEKSTAEHAVDGGPAPGGATAANLDPRWREVLPERLAALAAAWADPAAWQGLSEAGGVTMPSEITGLVALDELVLHGWDLATATGQDFRCEPADAEAVLGFAVADRRRSVGAAGSVRPRRRRTRRRTDVRPGPRHGRPRAVLEAVTQGPTSRAALDGGRARSVPPCPAVRWAVRSTAAWDEGRAGVRSSLSARCRDPPHDTEGR